MRIHDLSLIVEHIMEMFPETRNSDNVLYCRVCREMNPVIENLNFVDVMENIPIFEIPSYDSVSRSRRKIQRKREDLRASEKVIDSRYEKWKEVREYAEL